MASTPKSRIASLLLATVAATLMSAPAMAQFVAGGGGGNIELYADDVESAKGVTTLTGQVDARQNDVRILSDRMVIFSKQNTGGGATVGASAGDIDRIVATGNFFYITPEQEVRGDEGIYTAATDMFEVTGNVILTQEDSVVRGTRLIYDLTTEKARVISECQGRRCTRENRVAILIRNTPDPAAAPAAAPTTGN